MSQGVLFVCFLFLVFFRSVRLSICAALQDAMNPRFNLVKSTYRLMHEQQTVSYVRDMVPAVLFLFLAAKSSSLLGGKKARVLGPVRQGENDDHGRFAALKRAC